MEASAKNGSNVDLCFTTIARNMYFKNNSDQDYI